MFLFHEKDLFLLVTNNLFFIFLYFMFLLLTDHLFSVIYFISEVNAYFCIVAKQ